MGLKALRQIQIGEEATKGTPVAATAGLAGQLTMKSVPTINMPVEARGQLAEFSRSVKISDLAELAYEGNATFEQILYLLHMGVLGNVTAGSGGDDKTWTFTPTMDAATVFDSFTIEYGDDVEQWETEHCMASLIELVLAMNEPVMMRGDIFGRKMTVCNFTASQTIPTIEDILSQRARVYIDDQDGSIGATEKSSTLIAATYTINTGLTPKRYGDGSQAFSGYAENFKGVELKLTFAFNAGAETERLKFDGATQRLIRILVEGSEIKTVDSTATLTDNPLSISATTVNVSDGTKCTKHTPIKIDTEQMWVTAINANALTVVRGYNGTAPATHTQTTAVHNATNKKLILDACGIYTSWETLTDREGEDIVELTLSPQRGADYTKLFEVVVVNKVATLP